MSYLVKDFIGKKGRKGNIGIEIEVEASEALPKSPLDIWVNHADPSLRGHGMEYVTNGPLVITDVPKALKDLSKVLSPFKIDHKSPRASVHVHSNVMYHTPVQYWNMVTSYWLTENLLFDFCGDNRKGNCFCLRLSDAEGVMQHCLDDLRTVRPFRNFADNDRIRYAGQNLAATWKFGSIEYRGLSFTLDPEKITIWANALHDLSINSKDFKDPGKLLDTYFTDEPEVFLKRLYSKPFVSKITQAKDWRDKLSTNEGILCELAYFHDWGRWGDKIDKAATSAVPEVHDEIPEVVGNDPFGAPIRRGRRNDQGAIHLAAELEAFRIDEEERNA